MKKTAIVAFTMSALFVGCNKSSSDKVDLKSEDSKTFYTMGFTLGQRFEKLNLKDAEVGAIVAGLKDGVKKTKEKVDTNAYRPKIQPLIQSKMKVVAEAEKKSGAAYLDKFVKEGATKTESGLAYKILTEGKGANPKPTDTVKVHYVGTLTDGSVFDSSRQRNQPATFPLNRVIKGWTEGVQLIKPGGKIKLVIPSELAYGANGAPPKIPGGATLTFEVELLEIVKDKK